MNRRGNIVFPEIIKIYNYRSMSDAPSEHTIHGCDYLLNPIAVEGLPNTVKAGIWKVIGKVELIDDDHRLPDLKGGTPRMKISQKESGSSTRGARRIIQLRLLTKG